MKIQFFLLLVMSTSMSFAQMDFLLNPANPASPLNPLNPIYESSPLYPGSNTVQSALPALTRAQCEDAAKAVGLSPEGAVGITLLKKLEPKTKYDLQLWLCGREYCSFMTQIVHLDSTHVGTVMFQFVNTDHIGCGLTRVQGSTPERWLRLDLIRKKPFYNWSSEGSAYVPLNTLKESVTIGFGDSSQQDIRLQLLPSVLRQ